MNNKGMKKSFFNKTQQIIIISFLSVIVILLLFIILFKGNTSIKRTVMIYVVGSDLESKNGIVSVDLSSIDKNKINLDNTNILLYTGGTEKWHNFVKNDENAIYLLTKDGFKKLESQKQLNMGDPSILAGFINYAYKNYKADKYDLILYDHGGAIDGAIYDDFSNDNLSLNDVGEALSKTSFNEKNKIDAILFRTCLNGTLEVANIIYPYANYLIASEELSYGSSTTDVLSFLNEINIEDNGNEFGNKFLSQYEKQMEILDPLGTHVNTYSVINLSKIQNINTELDNFIKTVDISKDYNSISRIRNSIYQYGVEVPGFDMIDLYSFVEQLSNYSTYDSKKVLNAINEAVVFNKTNDSNSHGLSIYFPYNGKEGQKRKYLRVYKDLNFSSNYTEFITKFYNTQSNPGSFSFSVSKNEVSVVPSGKEVSLQLSEEQLNNFAGAIYTIFKKDLEHPDYYYIIYNSDDYNLDENGVITTKLEGNIPMIESDNKYNYLRSFYRKNQKNIIYNYAILESDNSDFLADNMVGAIVYFSKMDNNLLLSSAKMRSDNERIDGVLLDFNIYNHYIFSTTAYRILDDNGNVLDDWETAPITVGFEGKIKDIKLKLSGIVDDEEEYYCVFDIKDVNNNSNYSKLIRIG